MKDVERANAAADAYVDYFTGKVDELVVDIDALIDYVEINFPENPSV